MQYSTCNTQANLIDGADLVAQTSRQLGSSDLMSKLFDQSTWDLRERRDQASCAGGALHLRAALSWNWKLLNTLQMESRPSWSEKARSQLNHRNLRNCQHVELIKSLPQNIAYFITNAYLTYMCAQELYQYIKSKKVCKRKRVWEESPSKMPPLSIFMLQSQLPSLSECKPILTAYAPSQSLRWILLL